MNRGLPQFHCCDPSLWLHVHWKMGSPLPFAEPSASRHVLLVPSTCIPASALPLVFRSPLPYHHHCWKWSLVLQVHCWIGSPLPIFEPSMSRQVPLPAFFSTGRCP